VQEAYLGSVHADGSADAHARPAAPAGA
jgi:hypothetical protein